MILDFFQEIHLLWSGMISPFPSSLLFRLSVELSCREKGNYSNSKLPKFSERYTPLSDEKSVTDKILRQHSL